MNEQEPYRPAFFDMKLPITKELRQMVKEYHEYHGDLSCRVVKVVRDEVGYPSLLVRVKNYKGEKISCIESNAGGYISEIASAPTEDEACLLCWFSGEKEDGDYDEQDD